MECGIRRRDPAARGRSESFQGSHGQHDGDVGSQEGGDAVSPGGSPALASMLEDRRHSDADERDPNRDVDHRTPQTRRPSAAIRATWDVQRHRDARNLSRVQATRRLDVATVMGRGKANQSGTISRGYVAAPAAFPHPVSGN